MSKEEFILTGADGKTIFGDFTYDNTSTMSKGTIIFIHGFKGFKDWGAHNLVADYFANNGFRYLKYNESHSGVTKEHPSDVTDMDSFSINTISKELADLNTIINYVAHRSFNEPLYLIGHSRGGGLAILQGAKDERVAKIITWSAISDFGSLWKPEQESEWLKTGKIFVENARTKEKMPLRKVLLEDYLLHRDEYDINSAAKNITIPWLILHGDDDVNVKFSVAQQLAQIQLNAELQKIEGANHVFGASHPYPDNQLPEHLAIVCKKTLKFIEE